jgi:hypothetical protein
MIGFEGMSSKEEAEARDALDALCVAYPDHPWFVSVVGGTLRIRYLAFESPYGMNIRLPEVNHDAAVLKRKIIYLAGEWLERAGLTRGRKTDDEIYRVEGVPERWQPAKYREQKFLENVVIARGEERTEIRPQAKKEEEKNGHGFSST